MYTHTKRHIMIMLALSFLALGITISIQAVQHASAATLDPYEEASLLFVREEEKLARDSYITLYNRWGLDIFANIIVSEQEHMDAVLGLLDRYGIEDPASPEVGVFTDPEIQAKYDELMAWGLQSEIDALLVGCYIEEYDLIDLSTRMQSIDNKDILIVFQNLMDGSENHLRAFVSNYESLTGDTYVPVLLAQATYDLVINSDSDSGGKGRPR